LLKCFEVGCNFYPWLNQGPQKIYADGTKVPLAKREREFLSYLIKRDVEHHYDSITRLMDAQPPSESPRPLIVHLGYNVVPLELSVKPAQNEQEEIVVQQVKEDQIAVAARYSRGASNSIFMAIVPTPAPAGQT
jgi:hypothetical protein